MGYFNPKEVFPTGHFYSIILKEDPFWGQLFCLFHSLMAQTVVFFYWKVKALKLDGGRKFFMRALHRSYPRFTSCAPLSWDGSKLPAWFAVSSTRWEAVADGTERWAGQETQAPFQASSPAASIVMGKPFSLGLLRPQLPGVKSSSPLSSCVTLDNGLTSVSRCSSPVKWE